jgi:hypothetical protein
MIATFPRDSKQQIVNGKSAVEDHRPVLSQGCRPRAGDVP